MNYPKTGLTVSDVSRLFQGKGVDKKKCNEEKKGFPVIVGASSLQEGGVEVSRWIENPAPTAVMSKFGDILISAQGTCGKISVNNIGDAVITDAIIAVRPIPWLMDYCTLIMWIVWAIDQNNLIPEFDEDTVGFQRTIKADLIGSIEIKPLDTLKQIETVSAMKTIAEGFSGIEKRQKERETELHSVGSVEEVFKELESLQRECTKDLKDLKQFIKNGIKTSNNSESVIQEELF